MTLDQQIEGGSDLQLVTPSLSFQGGDSSGGSFNIRGITNLAVSATAESGVETHINDLPVGSYTMQDGDFFDLERIEVLRGPQGTLYGKNSVGGAINLITARPVLGEMSGSVKIENGSFNLRKMKTTFNLPLGDKMAVRLATSSVTRDGDIKNIYSKSPVSHINNRDSDAWRFSLSWDVNDKTDITVIHEAYDEDSMRHYVNNAYCQRDPSLVVGCTPGFPWSSQARGFFIKKKEITSNEHFSNPSLEEEIRVWHNEKNLKRRDKCFEIAEQKNLQPIQVALAYVVQKSSLIFPLIGPRTYQR